MKMEKYVKKPVVIEAAQWFHIGDMAEEVIPYPTAEKEQKQGVRCNHCGGKLKFHGWIDTVQGGHIVCPGDWIIKEPNNKGYYPCKPDVFNATHDSYNVKQPKDWINKEPGIYCTDPSDEYSVIYKPEEKQYDKKNAGT